MKNTTLKAPQRAEGGMCGKGQAGDLEWPRREHHWSQPTLGVRMQADGEGARRGQVQPEAGRASDPQGGCSVRSHTRSTRNRLLTVEKTGLQGRRHPERTWWSQKNQESGSNHSFQPRVCMHVSACVHACVRMCVSNAVGVQTHSPPLPSQAVLEAAKSPQ